MNEVTIVKDGEQAQIVSTIKFKPDTLYFTAPSRCWISGDLIMNGKRIGDGEQCSFLPDELKILNEIVHAATIRKNKELQKDGGIL